MRVGRRIAGVVNRRRSFAAAAAVSTAVFSTAAVLKVGGWERVARPRPGPHSVAPIGHGLAVLLGPNRQPPNPIRTKMAEWER